METQEDDSIRQITTQIEELEITQENEKKPQLEGLTINLKSSPAQPQPTYTPGPGEGEGQIRSTGVVKWFNPTKGFGFITPEDGGADVFVHQSEIQLDGFRSLAQGEAVEYFLIDGEKGPKALKVTGPHGSDPKGAPRSQNLKHDKTLKENLVLRGLQYDPIKSMSQHNQSHNPQLAHNHYAPANHYGNNNMYVHHSNYKVHPYAPLSPQAAKFIPMSPIPMHKDHAQRFVQDTESPYSPPMFGGLGGVNRHSVLDSPIASQHQFHFPVYPSSPITGYSSNFSFPTTPTAPSAMSSAPSAMNTSMNKYSVPLSSQYSPEFLQHGIQQISYESTLV